jgi:hypothetical protein
MNLSVIQNLTQNEMSLPILMMITDQSTKNTYSRDTDNWEKELWYGHHGNPNGCKRNVKSKESGG